MSELEFKESLMKLDTLLEIMNNKTKSIDAEVKLLKKVMRKIIEETDKAGTH